MRKKILAIIIIVSIVMTCLFIYYSYTNHDDCSGKTYENIDAFEIDTKIVFYDLYDVEEFMAHDKKILLQDANKKIRIWVDSAFYEFYSIELEDASHAYFIRIKPPYNNYLDNYEKIQLSNGDLYLSTGNEKYKVYDATFVKDKVAYSFQFDNTKYDMKSDEIKQKMIEYIKAVEDYNNK